MKTIDCQDRERILREQDPALLEALERHAASCPECAEELRFWNEISAAARQMHKSWESPHLWPRIEHALAAPPPWRVWAPRIKWWSLWPAAAVLATLLVVLVVHRDAPTVNRRLLTEQALQEVESSEAAYAASIDKLAALAGPKMNRPKTALMSSYREKLLLLDAAIADCRAQMEQNRGNPQVRQELLAMYQDKQRTLQAVIREE